ncbi:MAG: carbamoyltransferase HypF [Actinomycetota bacterium]
MSTKTKKKARTYTVKILGIVQGVGFRPFIYNLAKNYRFCGNVSNTSEGVIVNINVRHKKDLYSFLDDIKNKKPRPAYIEKIEFRETDSKQFNDFTISKSVKDSQKFQLISPDLATCKDCLKDINNPNDKRRYGYPFTNCTNCGPRFTIMESLPYDRPETTMKNFTMCSHCAQEYNDRQDRRFHAQPIACSLCGPKLWLTDNKGRVLETENPIAVACEKIRQGFIVAIKGLGGFQLACDATNLKAVRDLRKRKFRPSKPFAIMVGSLSGLESYYFIDEKERAILASPKAPIVLLAKKDKSYVAEEVSFYNTMEGVMLPYTPIHHLLFKYLDFPLVMTSGNRSEEPIAKDNDQALENLNSISDYFLLHNRDIYSRYDDSLVKVFDGKEMLLRRARGYSPYPVKIAENIKDRVVLALGAQEKNTFCLLKKNYAILSQHLGDLDDIDSFDFFKETLDVYKRIFNINNIDFLAFDKHPLYASTKFASTFNTAKASYQHHQCHVASVIAENGLKGKVLGFSWDGTGYGDDGKIWGSEIFLFENSRFKRLGHLTEKAMPGGEISIKKPYRMAISYLYQLYQKLEIPENFENFILKNFTRYHDISIAEIKAVKAQIDSGFNTPVTTSMGRLFDAVSSVIGLTHTVSYEGEAAIHLESVADSVCHALYEPTIKGFLIDDIDIFRQVINDFSSGTMPDKISAKFHNCLASAILEICKKARTRYNVESIALSGGVFQNNFLLKKAFELLRDNGFKVYTNFKVPVNDGGISLGQAYLAALHLGKEK